MKKSRRSMIAVITAASSAAMVLLAGCTTTQNVDRSIRPNAADGSIAFEKHQASQRPIISNNGLGTGSSWSAVLGGGYVGHNTDPYADSLSWRRDSDVIGQPRSGPLLATHQWPQPERPSIRSRTRIHFPRTPDTLIFFNKPSERRGPYWFYPHNWSY